MDDFVTIIEQVYESVYIHEEVYKELSITGQKFVYEKFKQISGYYLNLFRLFKILMRTID